MKKVINAFHKIAGYGTLLSMLGMILAVSIQIFARFLLPSAPNWTEEAARIFFIYLVAFGVAIGIRDNAFVRLELLRIYLSQAAQRRLQTVIFSIIFVFALIMLYYAFQFIKLGLPEQSPAIGINMSIVFASIFILMLSIALLSLEQILLSLNSKSKNP